MDAAPFIEPPTCGTCGARLASGSRLGRLCPRCLASLAEAAAPPESDDAGTYVGGYRLVRLLGEGGMGIVWQAQQDQPIRRLVALKILKASVRSSSMLARFDAERQALAILQHPHIATVLDAGVADDGRPYFVMEHVNGQTVTEYADEHRLTLSDRLELFLQVCEAVQHAHQKGVLHRDLKPSNILVTADAGRAVVKVIDFGLAKILGPEATAGSEMTQAGVLLGTPAFMSPEQARLGEGAVDTRTDVYSLGIVLYELLAGSPPHDAEALRGNDVLEILRTIREAEALRLVSRLRSLPPDAAREVARRRRIEASALIRRLRGDLEWIAARAIEKEPARRYSSAAELAADVERHLAHEPVLAGPPDLGYRLRKLAHKHRWLAAAVVVAIAALTIGGLLATMFWLDAEQARRDTADRFRALQVTTGLDLASADEPLKALPWLVAAMELEDRGAGEALHRVRLKQVLDGSPIPVRVWRHEGMRGAFLRPAGNLLATWDENGSVRTWDPLRGVPAGPAFRVEAGLADLTVSASGVIVLTADHVGAVRIWSVAAGSELVAPLFHGAGLRIVRMAPDERRVLTADRDGLIRIWDHAAAGALRLVTTIQHDVGIGHAEFVAGGQLVAAAGETGAVIVADSRTGRVQYRLDHQNVNGISAVGATQLLTLERAGVVRGWDLRTGQEETQPTAAIANGARMMRATRDGSFVALCGTDGGALVTPRRPRDPIRLDLNRTCESVDISPTGMSAIGTADGSLRVWRSSGVPLTGRLPHQAGLALVRFLEDGRSVVTADRDGVVRVWDLTPASPATGTFYYSWATRFSRDDRRLALASGTASEPRIGFGHLIDAQSFEVLSAPLRHGHNVRGIAFSPDGRLVATASMDATARLWHAASSEPASPPLPHGHPLHAVMFSDDGKRIATFGTGSTIGRVPATLWDVATGARIAEVGGMGHVLPGGFSPNGQHLLTVMDHTQVQIWRAADGTPVTAAAWQPYLAAGFLSDSEVVLVGARSLEVRRLDGAIVASSPASFDAPRDLVIDRARRLVAVPTGAGALHVWQVTTTLAPRFTLQLPGDLLMASFSSDGRWMGSVSSLRRGQIWSAETGEPAGPRRPLPPALPSAVSFTADGSRFQIGGIDATVWDLRPLQQPLAYLKKIASFLSAHELSASTLVRLSPARVVELARDPDVLAALPPADASRWQWYMVNQYIFLRQWTDAESETAVMTRNPDAPWEVWMARGQVLAELRRWHEASEAFATALRRRPDWTQLRYYRAMARYGGGDVDAVRSECAAVLAESGTTRNPDRAHWIARLCVLDGGLETQTAARVVDLSGPAADLEPDMQVFGMVHAEALLRSGQREAAIMSMNAVLARTTDPSGWAEAPALVALARGGPVTVADRLAVNRAAAAPAVAQSSWHRRLEVSLWREELLRRR
jgi:serine/threonine protein kinase/WD40 repeat protein